MTTEEAQRLAYQVRQACRKICTDGDRTEILTNLDAVATALENE